jgi:hypothetical protein
VSNTRRREFITLLGATAAWPIAAQARQAERVLHIGVLMGLAADDLEGRSRLRAFLQALQQFGWTDGRNGLTLGGAVRMPTTSANWRRNWSSSPSTSS